MTASDLEKGKRAAENGDASLLARDGAEHTVTVLVFRSTAMMVPSTETVVLAVRPAASCLDEGLWALTGTGSPANAAAANTISDERTRIIGPLLVVNISELKRIMDRDG